MKIRLTEGRFGCWIAIRRGSASMAFFGLLLLQAQTVFSATRTWSGGATNSFWTTPANWTGGVAPSPGDDLVFPQSAAQLTTSNNFPAGTTFNSITCSGGFYNFYGSNIVLHEGFTATNAASVDSYCYIPLTLDADQSFTID